MMSSLAFTPFHHRELVACGLLLAAGLFTCWRCRRAPLSSRWAIGLLAVLVAVAPLMAIIASPGATFETVQVSRRTLVAAQELAGKAKSLEWPTGHPLHLENISILRDFTNVSGWVIDPGGADVSGAIVTIASGRWDHREGTVERAATITDAAGHFEFDVSNMDGPLYCYVEATGYAVTSMENRVIPGIPQCITLAPASEKVLRLVDEAGHPMPGLRVVPTGLSTIVGWSPRNIELSTDIAGRLAQTTDAEGFARFGQTPAHWCLIVHLPDRRYTTDSMGTSLSLGDQPVTQILIPSAVIRGSVRYAGTGRPAAGIRVSDGWMAGVTDAAGNYEIGQLGPRSMDLKLELGKDFQKSWTAVVRENLPITKGQHLDGVDFELIPGEVVTGRVTVAGSGEPVEGVAIVVDGPAGRARPGDYWQTDADGRYSFRVPAGIQKIHLSYWPAEFRDAIPREQIVTALPGAAAQADFTVVRRPPATILQVVDSKGKAIPWGTLQIFINSRERGAHWDPAPQEPGFSDGVYITKAKLDVDDFAEGLRLRARDADRATVAPVPITGPGVVEIKIESNALGRVRGRVVRGTGQPMANVSLTLHEWAGGESVETKMTALTDKDGAYEFAEVWPVDTFSVFVRTENGPGASSEQFQLKPGETRELPPILVSPLPTRTKR